MTTPISRASSISIHALREEGDRRQDIKLTLNADFYPRPPRGGRLLLCGSCWCVLSISIHALREEGDRTASSRPPR